MKILRTPMTLTALIATLTPHQIQKDYYKLIKFLGQISNLKYAANFPVTINTNNTISVWHKSYYYLYVKSMLWQATTQPTLAQTNIYKVNGADDNSLGPICMTKCTLEFPKKFQQQFIVCKHLLWPVFSHYYVIGIIGFPLINCTFTKDPKSIIISDPAPFPLHVNQISTSPPLHIHLTPPYNKVTFNEKSAIMKENLCTKHTTYKNCMYQTHQARTI